MPTRLIYEAVYSEDTRKRQTAAAVTNTVKLWITDKQTKLQLDKEMSVSVTGAGRVFKQGVKAIKRKCRPNSEESGLYDKY